MKKAFIKVLNIVVDVLVVMVLIVSVLVLTMVLTSQNESGVPSVFGKATISVLTDSMKGDKADDFAKGDLIICDILEKGTKDSLKKGDIVTFNQDIKDSIMFEYHDCKNTNALPMVDIIFARDILSLLDEKAQESVVADFIEKMKGNAIAIIGENEEMPDSFSFGENAVGTLVAYTKD